MATNPETIRVEGLPEGFELLSPREQLYVLCPLDGGDMMQRYRDAENAWGRQKATAEQVARVGLVNMLKEAVSRPHDRPTGNYTERNFPGSSPIVPQAGATVEQLPL
jgi:hypothetical protein